MDWFGKLDGSDRRAVQRRLRAIEESDHFGVRKNLGGGLHELKFRKVLRVYFTELNGDVILLLGGSGKRDQAGEIRKARQRLRDYGHRTG